MKKIALILLLIIPIIGSSQTGPGGVGSNDGTSSLEIWLDASKGVYNDGGTTLATDEQTVQQWNDQSGNNHHATQTSNNAKPSFETTGSNSYPTVTFVSDASTSANVDYLDLTSYVGTIIDKTQSFFIVSTNDASTKDIVLYVSSSSGIQASGEFNGGGNGSTLLEASMGYAPNSGSSLTSMAFFIQDGTNKTDLSLVDNAATRIGYAEWNTGTAAFVSSDNDTGVTDSSPPGNNVAANTMFIGRHGSSTKNLNRGLDGDLSEVIIYNNILNSAEIIIVHNYLAAKYGLSLSANDIYDEDVNGNYDHDVAGIGRIDASNIQSDAQSDILRILNPTDLDDDEFLFWGHDNGDLKASNTTDIPSGEGLQARFDRVWRASERNTTNTGGRDVGATDVRFDLTGLGDVTASDLRLLIDKNNNNDFTDETAAGGGVISGATSLGGNIYEFAAVPAGNTGIRNNRRFTLGTINTSQTPLPIKLISLDATPSDHQTVLLDWKTASETNNNFFTVERSKDGMLWEEVIQMDGAGNSSEILDYSATDQNAYEGTSYYRLKQTDFNGQFTYSQTKSVILNVVYEQIKVYPNPTLGHLTIEGTRSELEDLYVYNAIGLNVSNLVTIINRKESDIVIDLSELPVGMYTIKTTTNTNRVYKY